MEKLLSLILVIAIMVPIFAIPVSAYSWDAPEATLIQRHIAELTTLTDDQIKRGDTDRDGKINVTDATNIQRYIAKLVTEFC